MRPECIVLDEPTAMLDPNGRKEVIRTVRDLQKQEKVTVILITHYMEEVTDADYIYVMDKGKVVMEGKPEQIFSKVDLLKHYRLDVPQATAVADELIRKGFPVLAGTLTREALCREVVSLARERGRIQDPLGKEVYRDEVKSRPDGDPVLRLKNLNYIYNPGTAYEKHAMKGVDLDIWQGEFIGIIGHTGSGKSTLIQHLDGLIRATGGELFFQGENIYQEGYSMKTLRQQVGLVFQYPEHQLFEADVLSDVCFGPKNQGLSDEECRQRAKEALQMVGFSGNAVQCLSVRSFWRTKTAGGDCGRPCHETQGFWCWMNRPRAWIRKGGYDILDQIALLQKTTHMTVILVSHSMEDVARYVDRIIVMNHGEKIFDDTPKRVFRHYKRLEEVGLAAPEVTYLMHELRAQGIPVSTDITLVEEAADEIERVLKQ